MARLYGPHYERVWRDALLLPGHHDLLNSLAAEVALHFGEPADVSLAKMRDSFRRRGELARERMPTRRDDLVDYYNDPIGIYVSAYWHSLAPDRYALHAVAGLHAAQLMATGDRVFEFGHGIGSAALLFQRNGFQVTAGDVSASYRDFTRARFEQRAIALPVLALEADEPERGSFDVVVSFDVLEHVPDPLEAVSRMRRWLSDEGVLVLNVALGTSHDNPEHLLPRRRGFEDRIRGVGFERVPHPSLLLFYRRNHTPLRRRLYRIQDTLVATRDDVVGRYPAAGIVLTAQRPPTA